MIQNQPVKASDPSSESVGSSASAPTAPATMKGKSTTSKKKSPGFGSSLFYLLFTVSVVINCAYVTGCCSFHLRTSDECGDRSRSDSMSEEPEKTLRRIAGNLKIQVPSDAGAEKVEELLLSALSEKKRFESGGLKNILESLRKVASDHSAEDDFDTLCDFIEKADGKTIIILKP